MEVSGQLCAPGRFIPRERVPVPTEKKDEWAPDLVWTLWRREKFLAHVRNRNFVVHPITISTKISWFPNFSNDEYLIFSHNF
jgi:hypothetical protein